MKVAGKIRCSTSKQDLESQRHTLLEWAKKNNHEIILFEEFAISGRKEFEARKSMQDLITRLETGEFEALVVVELSRLGRSIKMIYDLVEKLTKLNIKIILANSNTTLDYNTLEGRALIGGLALASDIEWMLISERNKRGREKIKREGIKVGRKHKQISEEAVTLMKNKGMSLRQIAKEMNTSPATIMRLLQRLESGHILNVSKSNQELNSVAEPTEKQNTVSK
jgi:putative DNA-invertase from lambdoid prophage Rac